MSRVKCLFLAVSLFLFIGCSTTFTSRNEFHIWGDVVHQMLQHEHESSTDFQVRVFQTMRVFTRQTGYESSGYFCQSPEGRGGIIIYTWHAHFSSPNIMSCPLDLGGFSEFGEFVHTHPLPGVYHHTPQDVIVQNRDRIFFKKSTSSVARLSLKNAQKFSDQDFKIGPGWVIVDNLVFHQEGRGTERLVMELPDPGE